MRKQNDYHKTALRLPQDLHKKIKEAAKTNGMSMNAEIIARLEKSMEADQKHEAMKGNDALSNITELAEGLSVGVSALLTQVLQANIDAGKIKVKKKS